MSDGPQSFEAALAVASEWVGSVPGVVMVGQGEQDGRPTVDVWFATPSAAADPDLLPDRVGDHPVRRRDSGGPVQAGPVED